MCLYSKAVQFPVITENQAKYYNIDVKLINKFTKRFYILLSYAKRNRYGQPNIKWSTNVLCNIILAIVSNK